MSSPTSPEVRIYDFRQPLGTPYEPSNGTEVWRTLTEPRGYHQALDSEYRSYIGAGDAQDGGE